MFKLLLMNQLLIVFIIVVSGVITSATLFTPCGGSATSFYINIEGCEDGVNDRCVFFKGNSYGFTFGGISSTSAHSLNTTVKVVLLTHVTTISNMEACENLQIGECPMELSEQFVYDVFRFDVLNSFPHFTTDMLIEIKNENKEHILCGKFKFGIFNSGNYKEDHIN